MYELAGQYEGLTEEVARDRAQARQLEQEVRRTDNVQDMISGFVFFRQSTDVNDT